MDSDLSTNAHECSSDNNNKCNALSHGLYGIDATGLWQYLTRGFDPPASRLWSDEIVVVFVAHVIEHLVE